MVHARGSSASRGRTRRPANRFRNRGKLTIPRTPYGVLGTSVTKTHVMAHKFNMNAPIGNVFAAPFRANDMNLPYVGADHSPYAFDTFATMYSHFTVTHARLKATFINSSGYKMFICVNAYPSDNIVDSNIPALIEQPGVKYLYLDPDNTGAGKSGGTLTYDLDMAKFFGRPKSAMINANSYRGTGATSPTELAYIHLITRAFNSSVDPNDITVLTEMTYTATWTEPSKLLQS